VERVDETLVVGVGVHGRHEAVFDAEGVIEHLREGARQFVVHEAFEMMKWCAGSNSSSLTPMTKSRPGPGPAQRSRRGSRPLRGVRSPFALGVLARRVDDDIDTDLPPGKRLRLGFGKHLDAALADNHRVAVDMHRLGVAPVHRVPSEQSGECLGGTEVVDRHDVELRVIWAAPSSFEGSADPFALIVALPPHAG
jgi:hypothetical protein